MNSDEHIQSSLTFELKFTIDFYIIQSAAEPPANNDGQTTKLVKDVDTDETLGSRF